MTFCDPPLGECRSMNSRAVFVGLVILPMTWLLGCTGVAPQASDAALMRMARRATVFWGLIQIAVALAAQLMDRSVLDAGLAVLSLATGSVLGAFLVGVLTRGVDERAMLSGMIAGVVVLAVVWWTGAVAWTWYALLGSAVTAGVACVMPRRAVSVV